MGPVRPLEVMSHMGSADATIVRSHLLQLLSPWMFRKQIADLMNLILTKIHLSFLVMLSLQSERSLVDVSTCGLFMKVTFIGCPLH